MRILTSLAKPGLVLSANAVSSAGDILLGSGTTLTRAFLRALHEEGVTVLEVEDDPRVEPWEKVPEVDDVVRGLEARFNSVKNHEQMALLRQAVQDVYLDFIFDLES